MWLRMDGVRRKDGAEDMLGRRDGRTKKTGGARRVEGREGRKEGGGGEKGGAGKQSIIKTFLLKNSVVTRRS